MNYTQIQDRRTFLKTMGVCALGVSIAPALRVLPAFAATGMTKVTQQQMLMGTVVNITVLVPSKNLGEEAIGRAFVEIQRQIGIFDRYDSSTPLSVLNQDGRLKGAPNELLEVVDFSTNLHARTGGKFDVTIAPVVNLLEHSHGQPSAQDLKAALSLVNSKALYRQGNNVRLGASGMAVTLDGVAKGFIADRAAHVLSQDGVTNFLIDAGGDIRVSGTADGLHRPWRVAIEDPNKQNQYPAIIAMSSGAVATSGGYEIFYDPTRKSTHLLNPATGRSSQYVRSVSVKAPTVKEADALATALSIMRPQDAIRLLTSLPGHSCFLVTSSGATLASPNWA